MSVCVAEMFETVRRRPAEYAWIGTCAAHERARTFGTPVEYDQLGHLTVTALDRCVFLGRIGASELAILVKHGVSGPPRADGAARQAWDGAIDILESEMNRIGYPPPAPLDRPCEPDDVVNALRRMELSPIHARTVIAWGKRRTEPPKGSEARRFWDEAMVRLTEVLRAKGIVRQKVATEIKLARIPLVARKSAPRTADRARAPRRLAAAAE